MGDGWLDHRYQQQRHSLVHSASQTALTLTCRQLLVITNIICTEYSVTSDLLEESVKQHQLLKFSTSPITLNFHI